MPDPYRKIPTEKLLRRVADARDAGDWTAARPEWEACIARARERVANVVDRYVAKGWIPRDEHEDVVQDALVRGGRRLADNLRSLSADAFFAAMVRVADFQCRDAARKVMAREQRETSLDERASWREGEAAGRHDRAQAREARELWERDQDVRDAAARIDAAVAGLKSPRSRRLVTMDRLGLPDDQIAAALGVTMANVYTIRSRALKELRGLIDP